MRFHKLRRLAHHHTPSLPSQHATSLYCFCTTTSMMFTFLSAFKLLFVYFIVCLLLSCHLQAYTLDCYIWFQAPSLIFSIGISPCPSMLPYLFCMLCHPYSCPYFATFGVFSFYTYNVMYCYYLVNYCCIFHVHSHVTRLPY